MNDDPGREARLRRMARHQGYQLTKIRRRNPQAPDFGRYRIIDPSSNSLPTGAVHDGNGSLSLDEVEAWLNSRRPSSSIEAERLAGAEAFGGDPVRFVQEGLAAGAGFDDIARLGHIVHLPSKKVLTGEELQAWYTRALEERAEK